MKSYTTRFSYLIGHHAEKQGLRSSPRDQGEVQNYATGTTSSQQRTSEDTFTEGNPQRGPLNTNTKTPTKRTRQKWTREEYSLWRHIM